MRLFIIAFQFLTIIPLPFSPRCDDRDLGRSMLLFPLVGLALGAALAGADYLLSFAFPRPVADLLLVLCLAVMTGALHLDGVADVCDGIAARGSRERFLEVMKDSRVGPVGAVGLILVLLLKYQALLAIPPAHKREALLLFPLLARFGQVVMTWRAERARMDGLGALFVAGIGSMEVAGAAAISLAAAWLLLGPAGLIALASVVALTCLLKVWSHRRLGGITGDIIGCASELSEVAALLAVVALASLSHQ